MTPTRAMAGLSPDWCVVVFDAECAICSASARHVLRHDRAGRFRLAPIQSPLGRELAREAGLDPDDLSSFLFIENGRTRVGSDGVIATLRGLHGAAANLLRVAPRPLRDRLYAWVARNRRRWRPRGDVCPVPPMGADPRILS